MESSEQESRWEHFTHDADVGIRGIGPTIERAFEMAAMALTEVVTSSSKVTPETEYSIQCIEQDVELLFLDWINALVYEMDTTGLIFSQFKVQIQGSRLSAKVRGEKLNREKHEPVVDVKGATMTELKVSKTDDHWVAQCVVDV